MTRVVKVNGRARDQFLADPDFVYVGRTFAGFRGSLWGNPFKPSTDSRASLRIFDGIPLDDLTGLTREDFLREAFLADAVERYEFYVKARKSLASRVPELLGKTLGCWCCDWMPGQPIITPCHAIIIAQLADNCEPSNTLTWSLH